MSACTYTTDANGIAEMVISNPPMNALSTPVIKDITETVKKALADDAVRVVVFTGAGRAFIAGADITEVEGLNEARQGSDYLIKGQEMCNLIENADKPFIAAINGFALGGGLEFALACHIRIADETAQLGLPEIKLGIMPGYAGTQRTPRLIGKARALELILSANFISGTEAASYGLVNRAVPKGESAAKAKELALAIAKKGRPAVKAAMTAVREGMKMDLDAAQKFERDTFGTLCETENKREGVAAFLGKREPEAKDC
jgi:enoyl-CoA hydratase/carnithine racemase